ncbi:MAG: Translocation and assembly module subunit TamB [Candidatus Erwinia impunctatus]|nr:Translocation and assembly module subunit TamB [Culicoides impunctatus]
MSRWKKVVIAILIVILVLLGSLFLLVATAPGLHLLLNNVPRWVPGLKIGEVEGGWRDLTLRDVSYTTPGVNVQAGEFHLSLRASCLIKSSFCLDDLALSRVNVVVDTQQLPSAAEAATPEPAAPVSLKTPWPVMLNQVKLNDVKVNVDGTSVTLSDFTSGAHWQGNAITLLPSHLQSLQVALPSPSEAEKPQVSSVPQPKEAENTGEMLRDLFVKPLLPALPAIILPVDVTVPSLVLEDFRLTGANNLTIEKLVLEGKTHGSTVQLDTFSVTLPQGELQLRGEAQLASDWPVNLSLKGNVAVEPFKQQQFSADLQGALYDGLQLDIALAGDLPLTLKATTRLSAPGLPLDLHLHSPQLRWPLSGKAAWQANDVDLRLTGKATAYQLTLASALSGENLPPATLKVEGSGTEEQFNLQKLHLAALQGNTELKGVVDWRQAISWRSELLVNGINTAQYLPAWPSTLSGIVRTRGSIYGGSWQLSVPELQLHGNIKQNKLAVTGSFTGNSYQQWDIPQLAATLGRNQLTLNGKLGDSINLDGVLDAQHLDNALPGLFGNIKGTLKARGSLSAPQLLADITGRGLRWQTTQINQLSLKGDISADKQIAGKLLLQVDQIKQDALTISSLTLDARGNEQQHQLKLSIAGQPVSGQLSLSGHMDRQQQRWQGTLSNTFFNTPVGEWRLTNTLALSYANARQMLSIGAHCWRNPDAEICVPQTIEAGASGTAKVTLKRFDLAMLKPFLSTETTLQGGFSGAADISWQAQGGLPQGRVNLQGKGVKVTQQIRGKSLPLAFETLDLTAALQGDRAQLNWLVKIANNGQFEGTVRITDPGRRRQLSGNVSITNVSLGLPNPVLIKGEQIAGDINSQLRLGGTLQQPQLFGNLALSKGKGVASFMPVELTAADLAITFDGMRSLLQGAIQTRQGALSLSGDADWHQPAAWRANVAAKGSKIRVTLPPMVRIDVSPDLVFEASPSSFTLNGQVDIPWARITVEDVPASAVGVSSDEVMLDANMQPVAVKSNTIPINSNLTVHVGNDVRLSAFGLNARLQGDLKVVQDKHGLGLNGQINIPSGRFQAYGQDLIVRKGELQFAGPADQPYLNIEAIRNPENTENDVTAGVRVTGLATEPKAEVFSDPAMSQQEALSYLLRGQGLDASGSDSSAITSALVGLGLAQSGQVVGKIGETFGVSNLALDTTGVGDSQQVQVSGYVLPGLQVKYGVGIFDSLATLTLRYRLMPKLYLEAVSGVDQALDVLYQFEF